jgi:hypothetical protein
MQVDCHWEIADTVSHSSQIYKNEELAQRGLRRTFLWEGNEMRIVIYALYLVMTANAVAQQSDDQQDKLARKTSGHIFDFNASPQECEDVIYKEVASGIEKDAGGATPKSLRLAPKLYVFTCRCRGGHAVSGPVMVGEQQSYSFHCEGAPPVPTPLSGTCDINKNDVRNVDDHKRIGDQDLFHILCSAPGNVISAKYEGCNWAGGERCSHINARNELSGPCSDSPMTACIFYQTNDGNFKVIHGSYTYAPTPPKK